MEKIDKIGIFFASKKQLAANLNYYCPINLCNLPYIKKLNLGKPMNNTKTIKKLNVLESRSSPLAAMRICFSGKSWDFPIKQIHISGLRQDIKVKNRKKPHVNY